MPMRGVGVQTLGATAQPVFGTTVTTAFQVTPDQFAGNTGTGANPSVATIVVASSAVFRNSDRVMIGTSANFNGAPAQQPDAGTVIAIVDVTHIKVKGLTRAHAAGEFVVLNTSCSYIAIQPLGSSAIMYVGEDSTVAVGSATLIQEIPVSTATPVPPFVLGQSGTGNVYDTGHLWIAGTATNTYLPSLNKI